MKKELKKSLKRDIKTWDKLGTAEKRLRKLKGSIEESTHMHNKEINIKIRKF